ncbi:TlpA family protein disulfide reductase [Pirellula sp. SH-Sr6A]|uniref:TlpA family protein disulfide reductase n=1 Tax=Pirellula sp. SH-Sr6A TaxID=1632865 RepID=UPI00143A65D4|nr:TlpA disulfide reductase family protein [Pirellula sp. SH-Sr6A]
MLQIGVCLGLALGLLGIAPSAPHSFAQVNENTPKRLGTLRLVGGDVLKGGFEVSGATGSSDGGLHWHCPSFAMPVAIPWEKVESIALDRPLPSAETTSATAVAREGVPRFVVEYWSGGCVTGEVESMDESSIRLRSSRFGSKDIPLTSIRTLLRVVDGPAKEAGMIPPESWTQTIPRAESESDQRWNVRVGSIQTETPGTSIEQRVFLPDVNAMEIDVAWTHSSPNWILTLGAPKKLELHVRKIEHRNALSVTLLFEENENADLATAIIPFEGLESMRLRILSDYIRGQFALVWKGKTIAEIRGKEKQRSAGVQSLVLTNVAPGGMQLRELRISRSTFSIDSSSLDPVALENSSVPKIILFNSEDFAGFPTDFQSADSSFGLAGSASALGRISLANVERIEFPRKAEQPVSNRSVFFVELENGNRYSSHRIEAAGNTFLLKDTPIALDIVCPTSEIIAIHAQRWNEEPAGWLTQPGRSMRISTEHVTALGELVGHSHPNKSERGISVFGWRIAPDLLSLPLNEKVSGTIDIFTRPASGGENPAAAKLSPQSRMERFGRLLQPGEPALYLTSGDSIPARLDQLRDGLLEVASEFFGNTTIGSSHVRGFRYLVYTGTDALQEDVLQRLLTVPRAQRSDPPTHLVVSREGDVVRGKLMELDPDSLVLDVRGTPQRFWSKNIAEVIWLAPPPELAPTDPIGLEANSQPEPPVDAPMTCQVVMELGTVLSIVPESIAEGVICGRHPQLGECRLPLTSCSRILFGDEIASNARSSQYSKWALRHAIDPKFILEEKEAADAAAGRSKWIGQQAPDIQVERLDGTPWNLTSRKGKVVVVDFWASWCGPCMKSLPEVAKIASDFAPSDVEFLALNLEEAPQVARAVASAMGLQEWTAIDRDGSIAKSYGAAAIPYTVVIGTDGIIRAVFIGSTPDTANRLRETIAKALAGDSSVE